MRGVVVVDELVGDLLDEPLEHEGGPVGAAGGIGLEHLDLLHAARPLRIGLDVDGHREDVGGSGIDLDRLVGALGHCGTTPLFRAVNGEPARCRRV